MIMVFILCNVVFNAFMLFIVLLIGGDLVHVTPVMAVFISYWGAGLLAILGYTKIGTYAVSLFIPGRAMVGREKARIEPLLSEVINKTNLEYNMNYKLSDFRLRVSDDKVVNGFAIGYNTIIINRGAFNAFTDEQLGAILAHEMAHLYYRDSVRSISMIFSSVATRLILLGYMAYMAFANMFAKSAKGEVGLLSFLPLLMFLPIILLNIVGMKVFELLSLLMSRGAEYRADAFAASLGYKTEMISVLEVFDDITAYDNSFSAKLIATHPAPMQRVGALEDEEIAKKKIGKLFVATPFSPDNAAHLQGNREVIRLSIIIVIIGVAWSVFFMPSKDYDKHQKTAMEQRQKAEKSYFEARQKAALKNSQLNK